jgi:ACS family sodium-dependent inorganic phosphate cotransporter
MSFNWQKRFTVVGLCFLGLVIAYTDRVNISIAAIDMQQSLGWTDTTKGIVLSSFFVGYLLFMVIGGVLANRYGGKIVLGTAVVLWSFFTILTPYAAAISGAMLIAARILLGAGEAVSSPSIFNLLARWVTPGGRARAVSFVSSGATVGALIALLSTGWIVSTYGWQMAFYSFGVIGLVWAIAWYFLAYDSPAEHPRISDQELDLLKGAVVAEKGNNKIPWTKLFSHASIWALIISGFCVNWSLYVFLAWLPSYFYDSHGLSIVSSGIFAAAPWLAMSLGMVLGGMIADGLLKSGWSTTLVRKTMQTVGLGGSSLCVLFAGSASSFAAALSLTIGALGLLSLCYSGFAAAVIDVAPEHSDVLWGVVNTVGTLPGIIGVAITGWMVETTGTYASAFGLAAAIGAMGTFVFLMFGTGDRVIQLEKPGHANSH